MSTPSSCHVVALTNL